MCIKAIEVDPWSLYDVPDHFKTQKICEKVVKDDAYFLQFVPDFLKTQEMCNKAVRIEPILLVCVSDHFKTQEMCDKAAMLYPWSLKYIPDWFVTQQQIKLWYDDDYYCNNDTLIEQYDRYKKRKAQKASIKEEILPIAWHPSRYWDWCMLEDEKKETEKLWA